MKRLEKRKRKRRRNMALDYLMIFVVALGLSFLVRQYVFSRADVSGPSMNNTLHDRDVIFIEKLCLLTKKYDRNDIVVFDSGKNNHECYIKRIIAIEGDTIEVKNDKVYINDQELLEDYLEPGTITRGKDFLKENEKLTIETGYVFVMGDNRENSLDSRSIGPIAIDKIVGHTILRVYPFDKIQIFK